jgi:hypothetical protein
MERSIWFQLVDSQGRAYRQSRPSKVHLSPSSKVTEFRKAVKNFQSRTLGEFKASQLIVYKNKASFKAKKPLKPLAPLNDLESSKENAIYIFVPPSSRSSSPIRYYKRDPDSHRSARWKSLQAILASDTTNKKWLEEKYYSETVWSEVGSVFEKVTQVYCQPILPLPKEIVSSLSGYLSVIWKRYDESSLMFQKETGRLHLVEPVIMAVVSLFPETHVRHAPSFTGREIDLEVEFGFLLSRGGKRICIRVSEADSLNSRLARDLLSFEVVSEWDGAENVCGIVTNFRDWLFVQSLDDKILVDDGSKVGLDSNRLPKSADIQDVMGKIYSLLDD